MPSKMMSSQPCNDDHQSDTVPNNNSSLQEWIPRGGGGGGGGSSTGILETPPQPPLCVDSIPNWRQFENQPRGNFVNQRNYVSIPVYSRKEKVANESNTNSSLPQLVQEIQEKLNKGTVECMICYDMVRRSDPIWSCSSCFSIFHVNCIKKWVRASTSVDLSAEKNQGLNWRCPGCQSVQLLASKEILYICFCGKRPDPPVDLYLTPHSCGESCGKSLEKEVYNGDDGDKCPHICVLQCHPGPCPPCKAFAPACLCPCGKKLIWRRCSDRKSLRSCGQLCNKILECGRHYCEKICHTGPCELCEVPMNAACFCKKKMEVVVVCGETVVKGELVEKVGVFSCNSICAKTLVCGNHTCGDICHSGSCRECELMPWNIKSCCCGKTKLQKERYSCLDPIPTCSNTCGKTLPCQFHQCKDLCHAGDCLPCLGIVNQKCRCRSSSRTIECYKVMEEKDFCCDKPCGRKKNCGRHRCSERCCPLSNSNNMSSGDWDPHLCSMICGKKLRCGQHSCESLCHSGHCPPCFETIFTDLTCACGKTFIPPPLPCGTPSPSCEHPCSVPQPCGHSSSHGCHFGDCPPCSVPVAKECIGGHVVLRNIPCGSKEIRCNQLCGKTRQCGMHACGKTCHPPPCDSSSCGGSVSGSKSSCGQICGAPRRDCKHTCTAPCHPTAPCPDLRCTFPVTITCSCGRITATVPCHSGGNSGGFIVLEASVIQKLPVPLQPVEANGKKIPLGQRKLVCDDVCVKMERKRVLTDAFDNTTPNLNALHFGENSNVSVLLADLFRREPKWVVSVEERFKFLVLGKSKGGNANGLRVHVFCPMLKEKRDAVIHIAERWKLSVHAAGWEPKRFLVVHVTPNSKSPTRMLGFKSSSLPVNASHPPAFDPLVDMDQRLVVSLLDLPRDADVSALVLRFGGECELVWLNDKNALAVFSDPARAATALRRLDHGSAYQGAVVVQSTVSPGTNAWGRGAGFAKEGGTIGTIRTNAWNKAVAQEPSWGEDTWGIDHDWSGNAADRQNFVWKGNVRDQDSILNSASALSGGLENPSNRHMGSSSSTEPKSSNSEIKSGGDGIDKVERAVEVVDD